MTAEIILASAGCAALCYTLGRHNRALTLQRWHFVLNAPEREAIESLRQKMQLDWRSRDRPSTPPSAPAGRTGFPTPSPSWAWPCRSSRTPARIG